MVFETEVGSATRLEYPIVADVDVDGKAKIVVVANEALFEPNAGIFVYGTPSDQHGSILFESREAIPNLESRFRAPAVPSGPRYSH